MHNYVNQSEAMQNLAAEQIHSDLHAGRGVVPPPSNEEIAARAHEIYISGGRKEGHWREDWEQAEKELRARTFRS